MILTEHAVASVLGFIAGSRIGFIVDSAISDRQERVDLNKADKACKTSGQQCDTAGRVRG